MKLISILKTTSYAGNYIYKYALYREELKSLNHPQGYIEPNNPGSFDYIYQYKDHLGNIRLSYKNRNTTSNPVLEIQEENNYYPFGLQHKGYNNVVNGTDHPYGFGGKEEQNELGLDWIDITARNYDPALGRWMNLDPLAEQIRRHSPYNYAFNNPIFFIDPDGMAPDWIRNEGCDGTITYEAEAGDSAWSLYTQHGKTDGFTAEQANVLVEGQLGENYTGEGGGLKSDVEVGDTLTVHTEQGSAESEINVSETTTPEGLTKSTETQVPYFGVPGDITGANALMESQNTALDIYEARGMDAYIYFQIAEAHREIAGGMGNVKRGNSTKIGTRGTTDRKATSAKTITVSGQKEARKKAKKTLKTGTRQ